MTEEQLIDLARQANGEETWPGGVDWTWEELHTFAKLVAEQVQKLEPVAWRYQSAVGGWAYGKEPPIGSKYAVEPLYTSPQRCQNCASLEAQNTELDAKLANYEKEETDK